MPVLRRGAATLRHLLASKLALMVIGLFTGLVVTELLLRVFMGPPVGGVPLMSASDFQVLPGVLTPNQNVIDRQIRQLPYRVRTDSLGYRGADFPRTKPVDEFRILMVGDSFTWGEFVAGDQTLPAQLEQALRKRCAGMRVINAGVAGASIITAKNMVKRALPLEPDLVILTFSPNDVTDLKGAVPWDRLVGRISDVGMIAWLRRTPLRQTALWIVASKARARLRASIQERQTNDEPHPVPDANATLRRLRGEYETAFRDLRDLLMASNTPFVFTIYPSFRSVSATASIDYVNWAVGTGRSAGVRTLNLLPALRSADSTATSLYLVPIDAHPSPLGVRIATEVMIDSLTTMETVARFCRGDQRAVRQEGTFG